MIYNFDVVKDFIYLGTVINTSNDVSLEIERRVTLAILVSIVNLVVDLSRAMKLTLYKALILHELLCGTDTWTLSSIDAVALGVFERKVLRKIFGIFAVRVGDDYRIRTQPGAV